MVEVVEGAAACCHEPDCVCEALVIAVTAQRGLVPLQHRGARLDTNPVVGEHRPAAVEEVKSRVGRFKPSSHVP